MSPKQASQKRDVYIVDGKRTPFIKAKGKPGAFLASDLAVAAARPLLLQNSFDLAELDEVIVGCVMPTADEANIARVIALRLGIPQTVPAWTVQRNCASGMQALDCGFQNIQNGQSDLILAGGTEAMSRAPILHNDRMVEWLSQFMSARTFSQKLSSFTKLRPAHLKPIIALVRGLSDPIVGLSMGQTTEEIAYRFGISRDQMDEFSVASHQRLGAATDNGHLDEIEPVYDNAGAYYDFDDGIRRDSSMPNLAKLKPYFDRKYGKVTPGNSAQITDGAAMLLLASESAVKKYNLNVLAKITDSEWAGCDPSQMGLGPAHAMAPIMERNKLSIEDVDNWEINEAFAGQVLGVLEAWKDTDYCKSDLGLKKALGEIPHDKLNIDGGGVSIGHPVGASGARIVLHVANNLKRNKGKRGIASLCIGGGQGGAMMIEAP
ncbi:MAG: acetyl-CoA C-acetyltransferase [endosymbiont of Galathealinum brachiosum]|uniref:Acetyl-CoA C-acetyltransferase n=1 Tax=endosymbiont of Galathealinum brachiosum TaxID=2200906 RepID=A0A370DP01_9GAMM|nr:MAG: acetyl-CoA C-acetyltransferase [endosymbiont of Galathealinum brachiosum]